mmetsp:Transcript_18949/g.42204  ORF Transcript_18949/g.42204 Transcript_18949/m.42204 type:complete len:289 (-) Transcript_18949:1132-1998(-)
MPMSTSAPNITGISHHTLLGTTTAAVLAAVLVGALVDALVGALVGACQSAAWCCKFLSTAPPTWATAVLAPDREVGAGAAAAGARPLSAPLGTLAPGVHASEGKPPLVAAWAGPCASVAPAALAGRGAIGGRLTIGADLWGVLVLPSTGPPVLASFSSVTVGLDESGALPGQPALVALVGPTADALSVLIVAALGAAVGPAADGPPGLPALFVARIPAAWGLLLGPGRGAGPGKSSEAAAKLASGSAFGVERRSSVICASMVCAVTKRQTCTVRSCPKRRTRPTACSS